MDDLFTVLSTSSDNAARKVAASQLRQLQEQQPEVFLRYTWDRVACATLPPSLRFFVCATVASFVDDSWHSAVTREMQASVLQMYVEQLALRERFASVALARKVATVIARMAKRSSARSTTLPRGLPPLVEYVVQAYVQALHVQCAHLTAVDDNDGNNSVATATTMTRDMLPQVLLLLHVFLTEMQSRRVGVSFAQLCRRVAVPLSALFVRMTTTLDLAPQHGQAYLYMFKCAMRVYGCGVLDGDFCRFALTLTWQLATRVTALQQQQQQQQAAADGGGAHDDGGELAALLMRLLEYAMKIHVNVVANFAHTLSLPPDANTTTAAAADTAPLSPSPHTQTPSPSSLPLSFFLDDNDNNDNDDRALLRLLTAIIVANGVFSLRVTCRALRLFAHLCSLEHSSAFASALLRRVTRASPPLLPTLLSHLITDYFADDVSATAQRAWATTPEDVVDAFDTHTATATAGSHNNNDSNDVAMTTTTTSSGDGLHCARATSRDAAAAGASDVVVGGEDEHALIDAAEQLFLALTSSPAASADALRETWAVVHRLLAAGDVRDVTAALHVIGIGHSTMRSSSSSDNRNVRSPDNDNDDDDDDYVQFLTTRLLPVLHASASADAAARPDMFVQRRVLWLVGMWCEAVPRVHTRRAIHVAVEALLRLYTNYLVTCTTATTSSTTTIDGTVVVLALTALRCVQHFVADNTFTRAELPTTFVATVMTAVQHLLPLLRAPSAVAAAASVVHVLLAKLQTPDTDTTAMTTTTTTNNNNDNDSAAAAYTSDDATRVALRGDDVVCVFHPAVLRMVQRYNDDGAATSHHSNSGSSRHHHHTTAATSGSDSDSDSDDDDAVNVGTLTLLLECLASAVRAGASDVVTWALLDTVVVPCTTPGGALAPWVQDEAWELLLAMAQSARDHHASAQQALAWALHNTQRDFTALHTVLRVVYTLLLLQLLALPSSTTSTTTDAEAAASLPPSSSRWPCDAAAVVADNNNNNNNSSTNVRMCVGGVALRGAAEDYCSAEQVLQWLTTLVTTTSHELVHALQALLAVVARTSAGPLCELVVTQSMAHLVVCGDVQAVSYALPLCVLLNVALLASASSSSPAREKSAAVCFASPLLAHDTAARTEAALSLFAEQLVLLLDVSTSALTTQCVVRLLRYTQETLPVSADDAAMMQSAADAAVRLYTTDDEDNDNTRPTVTTTMTTSGNSNSNDDEDDEQDAMAASSAEVRPFAELLIELFEDNASLPPSLPHLTRVLHAFALLQ